MEGRPAHALAALKAEVDEYIAQHADHRDKPWQSLVVCNGWRSRGP
jgi:hypothetical protein